MDISAWMKSFLCLTGKWHVMSRQRMTTCKFHALLKDAYELTPALSTFSLMFLTVVLVSGHTKTSYSGLLYFVKNFLLSSVSWLNGGVITK